MCGTTGIATHGTLTDSNGNTIRLVDFAALGSNRTGAYAIVVNSNSGANTVTCTGPAGTSDVNLIIGEYAGLDTVSPIEVLNQASGLSLSTISTGYVFPKSQPGELLGTFVYDAHISHSWTINNGFTIQKTETCASCNAGAGQTAAYADLSIAVNPTLNYSATWTDTGTAGNLIAFIFGLRAAGSTGPSAFVPGSYIPIVQTNSSNLDTCSFGQYVTTGDILVAMKVWSSTSSTPSISDTVGTSFSQSYLNVSTGVNGKVAVFTGIATGTGYDAIVMALAGEADESIMCAEFPPFWSITVDVSVLSTYSGTPASITSSSFAPTLNGDLVLTVTDGTGGTFSNVTTAGYFDLVNYTQAGPFGVSSAFGTSTASGAQTVTVQNDGSASGFLAVVAFKSNSIAITSPTTIPSGFWSTAYAYTLLATGGAGSYTWSVTAGSLQSGLSLNTSTGAITGTPTASSTNNITFQVTDGTHSVAKAVNLTVGRSAAKISHVQDSSGPFSENVFTGNVTAGDGIIVSAPELINLVANGAANGGIGYCTDTLGTSFKLLAQHRNTSKTLFIYGGIAPTSGAETVQCGLPGNQYISSISEFANVQIFNDNQISTTGPLAAGGVSYITGNSLTTLVPNELLFAVAMGSSGFYFWDTTSALSPFTNVAYEAYSFINGNSASAGWDLATAVTGYASVFTLNSVSGTYWNMILIGFRPSVSNSYHRTSVY
jgi:hypothetical protein